MPKQTHTTFICQSCSFQSRKWLGKCPECGEWNSLIEERLVTTKKGAGRNGFRLREARAVAYTEIESQDDVRISSGVTEFDRVLGGGIVPGTLVLLGGDPGIGKSTLLLQVADKPASRTGGDAFPMRCLKSQVLSKFTRSASIRSRTWSKPRFAGVSLPTCPSIDSAPEPSKQSKQEIKQDGVEQRRRDCCNDQIWIMNVASAEGQSDQ